MASDQFPPNDHDAIANMWPRLHAQEEMAARHQAKIDTLESAVGDLKQSMADLAQTTQAGFHQLKSDLDSTFTEKLHETRQEFAAQTTSIEDHLSQQNAQIEEHLNAQDATVNTLRETVAGAKADWPRAAIVFVSIAGTALTLALVQMVSAGHW